LTPENEDATIFRNVDDYLASNTLYE